MEQGNVDPNEKATALFANMVMQQANAALMFMGKVPNPENGETMVDLDAARYFIDLIEMLQQKTKGNLGQEESTLLQQSLTTVRMAFVEAANQKGASSKSTPPPPAAVENASAGQAQPESPASGAEAAPAEAEADSRKKFVKKY